MIYFLINNNYHLYLDQKLAKKLSGFNLGLIQVPYSLDVVADSDIFQKVYCFRDKIISSLFIFLFKRSRLIRIFTGIDKTLTPEPNDVLLVHTDMDLLNQYIIQKFHAAGAKIYLLEDGTATMCYYNTIPHEPPFKDRIKTLILKYFYHFVHTSIKVYGVAILPVMEDSVFNGVIVNFGNSIIRNIPLYKLEQLIEPFNILFEEGAIFFSQPIYYWFATEGAYINYIDVLLAVSVRFSPFYFKFHPSESEHVRLSIINLINNNHKNVTIISENDIAENIIGKYPVRYAITFNSSAVMNLISKGIVPVFLNDVLHSRFPDSSFIVFGKFLESIECNVPSSLSDVKPGFKAFDQTVSSSKSYSITEIVNF